MLFMQDYHKCKQNKGLQNALEPIIDVKIISSTQKTCCCFILPQCDNAPIHTKWSFHAISALALCRIRSLLDGPFRSLFYFLNWSVSSVFWVNSREKCQFSLYTHLHNIEQGARPEQGWQDLLYWVPGEAVSKSLLVVLFVIVRNINIYG